MSQITKKAIEASLKNLLLKKPFDKITINDIAEDCGISRMTFYYHFKDIYDLVEWACEEDVKKILEDKDDYKTWTQGFLNLFEEVLKNKPFILNVYRSVGREQVENYLYKIVYDLLLNVIEEKAQGMTVRDEDKEFVADFYKYAFVGLMLDWVKNGMKEDPHKIVKKVEFLLSGSLSVSLERFRTGRISQRQINDKNFDNCAAVIKTLSRRYF